MTLQATPVIAGEARGLALVSDQPLSFWGGYDWQSGEIIDRRHPLSGSIAAGRILCVPFTRGSSTTTAVLLEALHAGTAPAAILTTQQDFFFALASVVAEELFAARLPLMVLAADAFAALRSGMRMDVFADGRVCIQQTG